MPGAYHPRMSNGREPTPTPSVRLATLDDAEPIARAQVASWHAAYTGLIPEAVLAAYTVEVRTARWRAILARDAPEERTWVAPAGHPLGFISLGPCRDEGAGPTVAELYGLYLDPSAWGGGLGRALFEAAAADCRARARSLLTAWVLEGNARARRFYEIAGMRPDGAHKIEMEQGAALPHVRYTLPLAPVAR